MVTTVYFYDFCGRQNHCPKSKNYHIGNTGTERLSLKGNRRVKVYDQIWLLFFRNFDFNFLTLLNFLKRPSVLVLVIILWYKKFPNHLMVGFALLLGSANPLTSRTTRKFTTNMLEQIRDRRFVKRVLERENVKWRLGAVPQAYIYIHTPSVRVKPCDW